jgi:alkanesulfonate monooxygenase SsuD/methylene tetrahydromethanopterin reductase-like flavin-dependent oxidoreductase (luciferase family)
VSSGLDFGLSIAMFAHPGTGVAPSWSEVKAQANWAETAGFDTIWAFDEIGAWECLTLTGALAASTSTIKVGTWVLSTLQHNPAMLVAAAETLDEIAGGRFVLGVGAGHPGQADNFGFPTDRFVSRYAEALEILVPLLRGNEVTFDGQFHRASAAAVTARGPRPGRIPLMLGGLSPRTRVLAATHADIWSCYATTSSYPEAFVDVARQFERECERVGRDPATIEKSVSVIVDTGAGGPTDRLMGGTPITGSNDEIIDAVARFLTIGFTRVEFWWGAVPPSMDDIESLAPIIAALR